jgi:hypothetical protein
MPALQFKVAQVVRFRQINVCILLAMSSAHHLADTAQSTEALPSEQSQSIGYYQQAGSNIRKHGHPHGSHAN